MRASHRSANTISVCLWSIRSLRRTPSTKTYGPPRRQAVSAIWSCQSASTYPACGRSPGQDGESRVPVLITPSACDRHIRYQVAGTPVRLSGHLVSTTHRPRQLPAPVSAAGQSQSHGFHRGSIVGAAVAKHCPHDAGQLVGQRNHDLVLVRAYHQALQPLPDWRRARR